jgi:hypothetical protein
LQSGCSYDVKVKEAWPVPSVVAVDVLPLYRADLAPTRV